jgi:hypothetical protein
MYTEFAWLIIMGSGFDDWIYWHFFIITDDHTLNSCWITSVWRISHYSRTDLYYYSLSRIRDSTAWEPDRDHSLQGFHSCVSRMCCLGNRELIRGNALISPSVFVAAKRVLTVRYLAMDHFVHYITLIKTIFSVEYKETMTAMRILYLAVRLMTTINIKWIYHLSVCLSVCLPVCLSVYVYISIYGSRALCWSLAAFSVSWYFIQSVELLARGSARRKAVTYTQNNTNTDIHASSGIRNHDPSVQAGEDSSYLRPRGHCDRLNA